MYYTHEIKHSNLMRPQNPKRKKKGRKTIEWTKLDFDTHLTNKKRKKKKNRKRKKKIIIIKKKIKKERHLNGRNLYFVLACRRFDRSAFCIKCGTYDTKCTNCVYHPIKQLFSRGSKIVPCSGRESIDVRFIG